MMSDLTNLLPEERRRALDRGYLLRLGTVAILAVVLLFACAAALLVPTEVFLADAINTKNARLTVLNNSLDSADAAALSARLATLGNNVSAVSTLATVPHASSVMSEILAIVHPSIVLTGFTYVPPVKKAPATIAVSGTAATRDALRSYQLALQSAPFASAVDLPVSAYAQDANISFTMTVTLAP